MQLKNILDLVDSHPHTRILPGAYKSLTSGRVYIIAESGGDRQVRIVDRYLGQTVFLGDEKGIQVLVDGPWQQDVTTAVNETPVVPVEELPVNTSEDTGDLTPRKIRPEESVPEDVPTEMEVAPSDIKEEDIFAPLPSKKDKAKEKSAITPEVLAQTAPETVAGIISEHELEAHKDEPVVQEARAIKNRG